MSILHEQQVDAHHDSTGKTINNDYFVLAQNDCRRSWLICSPLTSCILRSARTPLQMEDGRLVVWSSAWLRSPASRARLL